MIKLEDLCIESDKSLLDALQKINNNNQGIVFVVEDEILYGCLTDGDIRRAFIDGANQDICIKSFCNQNITSVHVDAPEKDIRSATNDNTRVIPLVDDNKRIVDFATLSRPHNVVLMEPFLGGNELDYVVDCLKTNWISSQGAYVNLFEEMHLAALVNKAVTEDAESVPAQQVIRMATINGAKALGLENEIGSLEVGKRADIILLDSDKPHYFPRHNPSSSIAYSAQAADVCTVLVNGKVLMENYELKTIDVQETIQQAELMAFDLVLRVT